MYAYFLLPVCHNASCFLSRTSYSSCFLDGHYRKAAGLPTERNPGDRTNYYKTTLILASTLSL